MKTLAVSLLMILAPLAYADGYVCESTQKNLHLEVQQVAVDSATIRVSDPRANSAEIIAQFSNARSNLNNRAASYEAKPDFDTLQLVNDGAIGNTRLSELARVNVAMDFSYGKPLVDGEYVPGALYLTRHDASVEFIELDCERSLN